MVYFWYCSEKWNIQHFIVCWAVTYSFAYSVDFRLFTDGFKSDLLYLMIYESWIIPDFPIDFKADYWYSFKDWSRCHDEYSLEIFTDVMFVHVWRLLIEESILYVVSFLYHLFPVFNDYSRVLKCLCEKNLYLVAWNHRHSYMEAKLLKRMESRYGRIKSWRYITCCTYCLLDDIVMFIDWL